MWQLVNVDAAGRDVCCYQHLQFVIFELMQDFGALSLALVAVNGGCLYAIFFQQLHQLVGTMFCAAEHQYLVPVVGADQVAEQLSLARFVHRMQSLSDTLCRGVHGSNTDLHRIVQQAARQFLNLTGKGC